MQVTFRCLPELEPILPKPIPARRGLPEWLKRMPMSAPAGEFEGTVKTVKRCSPFVDAMSAGFLMPLPCDLHYAEGCFEWDWRELPPALPRHTPRSPLSFHVNAQLIETPLYEADAFAIKFNNLWTIETEPGVALLVTHPINRPDLPFRALTGLVDTDRYTDNYVHFPALWVERGFAGVVPKGTPVAQCIPVPRGALEVAFAPLDAQAQARLAEAQKQVVTPEGAYKRRYRAKRV
ncbi:MAG: hypothetical protein ACE5GS_00275 [Kiloniellaceae bacterium]